MNTKELVITFYKGKKESVNLRCEVAESFASKMTGLMYREFLPENRGMIFPFLLPNHRFFWMKNVKIPLDIIFVNSKREIIYIHETSVEKGIFHKSYWSHGFCRYVVETNRGFCKKNEIKKGHTIKINR